MTIFTCSEWCVVADEINVDLRNNRGECDMYIVPKVNTYNISISLYLSLLPMSQRPSHLHQAYFKHALSHGDIHFSVPFMVPILFIFRYVNQLFQFRHLFHHQYSPWNGLVQIGKYNMNTLFQTLVSNLPQHAWCTSYSPNNFRSSQKIHIFAREYQHLCKCNNPILKMNLHNSNMLFQMAPSICPSHSNWWSYSTPKSKNIENLTQGLSRWRSAVIFGGEIYSVEILIRTGIAQIPSPNTSAGDQSFSLAKLGRKFTFLPITYERMVLWTSGWNRWNQRIELYAITS